ncbi:hypothetical protein KKF34_02950 [Myxococcota bacterium]|nr:hypothetical protein [Myxococcota bacterium]MBU1382602.1 hypothetical protein [Myxococcota bacterium]MBU1495819.1 hypothetical protein [Myxococcota bacterium]
MKRFQIVVFLVSIFIAFNVEAREKGPTLKSVSDNILYVVPEDGSWSPKEGWWTSGLDAGTELKVVIKTSAGKSFAWATFNFRPKAYGDFAKVQEIKNQWPAAKGNKWKIKEFKVGKYTLDMFYGKTKVWTTDFVVKNDKFEGKNHYYIIGRWTKLTYFTFSKGSVGSRVCGWFAPPETHGWFPSKKNFRGFDFTGDIKQNGKVIVSDSGSANRPFQIDRGRTAYICKGISFQREIVQKVSSKDGEYVASAYASKYINGKKTTWTVMSVKFTIKNGKLVMNEKLSGPKAPALTRIITDDAVYRENDHKLESIPVSKD